MATRQVVGIDEVGRGPWAGPLVAAAVLAGGDDFSERIIDSKRLPAEAREELLEDIQTCSRRIGIGWASPRYIDVYGLTAATTQAMGSAVAQLGRLSPATAILMDGHYNYLPEQSGIETHIKGDGSQPVISAASIVAKVLRDRFMHQLAGLFPAYGFEQHVGYGTPGHRQKLYNHGPCRWHRYSFTPVKTISGK